MLLLLQLSGQRLARAGDRVWVLTSPEDRREYGRQRSRVHRPLRVLPTRVVAAIRESPAWSRVLDPDRLHADDRFGTLHLVARPQSHRALREILETLDGEASSRLWARIPVSHLDEEELRAALEALPEGERSRLPSWVFQEKGRQVVARGTAEALERLQRAIRAIDLAPGQAFLEVHLLEVSREQLEEFGMRPASGAVELRLPGSGAEDQSSVPVLLRALLRESSSRSLGSRSLMLLDGARARLQVGSLRNVPSATATSGPGGIQVTRGVREVALGVTLDLEARIHGDGSATLELELLEESPLAIRPEGIDRTRARLVTRVRARIGHPLLLAGLGGRNRSHSRSPLIGSRSGSRSLERVLLLVLHPGSAGPVEKTSRIR